MDARTFFKHFRWWNFAPALLFAAAGVAVLCTERAGIFPVAVTCGVLFTLMGAVLLLAFFFSLSENVASLLLGVCGIAVSVWLFAVRLVPMRVFVVALAVLITLYALSEVFEALLQREDGGKAYLVRIVLAAVIAGLADGFAIAAFFTSTELSVPIAGAAMLGACVCTVLFTLLRGAFVPEEELHFRPVKK